MAVSDFRRRFFDARSYLNKRRAAPFGSARNPEDNTITIPDDEYLELTHRVVSNHLGPALCNQILTMEHICDRISHGETIVLVGPFGAGKSLSVREAFVRLSSQYLGDKIPQVPVAVSLRDHWGSKYADEILERHAREIGFTPREDLLVAWRAGLAVLLIDGFDEVAAQVVVSPKNKNFMREARFQALSATRDLIQKSPAGCGCLITGRNHYFDTDREMIHALGLAQRKFTMVELQEFSESQAETYVHKKAGESGLPDWLPRKPLILSYLAQRTLLKDVLAIEASEGFAQAWDRFLSLICEREAAYGSSVMDPETLRRLLERLAWDVRSTASGSGPITERDLADAYLMETGQNAGEGVLMQLQRLPGLTPRYQDPGSRSFVDADMLAALQGGALARFILELRKPGGGRASLSELSRRSAEMAAYLLEKVKSDSSTAIAAGMRASDQRAGLDTQLAADCVSVALTMSDDDRIDCLGITVRSGLLREVPLEDKVIDRLILSECGIEEVSVGPAALQSSITFDQCFISRLVGASDHSTLPKTQFRNCEIEEFDSLSTNAAIVKSELPARMKGLLTVLRKLYLQAGGGRKVAALKRGLPSGAIIDSIDDVVRALEAAGLVSIYNGVAHPIRRHTARVQAILQARSLSDDPIVRDVLSQA
jgi:hypothetical protein